MYVKHYYYSQDLYDATSMITTGYYYCHSRTSFEVTFITYIQQRAVE